jgi:hypothetical protein
VPLKTLDERREALYVHDELDHTLMLVEMEGEPVEYTPGVAGEFISRRSVNFHDRIKGSGSMQGYAITHFQYGSVFGKGPNEFILDMAGEYEL